MSLLTPKVEAVVNNNGLPDTVRHRLLLIDDAPDNLEVLTIMLSGKYDVLGYSSAEEAMLALINYQPELLLLDVAMAPVNGMDLLREIRSMKDFLSISAIAVTGFARDVDREMFLAAGFQAVVTKPIVDLTKLEEIIDGLLSSSLGSEAA